jgi:hypothetical protein
MIEFDKGLGPMSQKSPKDCKISRLERLKLRDMEYIDWLKVNFRDGKDIEESKGNIEAYA